MMIQTAHFILIIIATAVCGALLGMLIGMYLSVREPQSTHFYKCDRCGRMIHGYKSKYILPRGFADKRRVHLCYLCQSDIEEGKPYLTKDIELRRIENGRKDYP